MYSHSKNTTVISRILDKGISTFSSTPARCQNYPVDASVQIQDSGKNCLTLFMGFSGPVVELVESLLAVPELGGPGAPSAAPAAAVVVAGGMVVVEEAITTVLVVV